MKDLGNERFASLLWPTVDRPKKFNILKAGVGKKMVWNQLGLCSSIGQDSCSLQRGQEFESFDMRVDVLRWDYFSP